MSELERLLEDLDFEINFNGEFTDKYYSLLEEIRCQEHILLKDE